MDDLQESAVSRKVLVSSDSYCNTVLFLSFPSKFRCDINTGNTVNPP
jgi:hypothetical protein